MNNTVELSLFTNFTISIVAEPAAGGPQRISQIEPGTYGSYLQVFRGSLDRFNYLQDLVFVSVCVLE